ncbi:MAG: hypothetical protein HYY85_18980 [Deltaproteobacteria bacterium]|nr:hypothetical protein [Deltaproteobacteria bacterium]
MAGADYKANLIVDPDCSLFGQLARTRLEEMASATSEDVLIWNVFRSLDVLGKLGLFLHLVDPGLERELPALIYYWARWERFGWRRPPDVEAALKAMEPGAGPHAEPDIIIRTAGSAVVIECELGGPGEAGHRWQQDPRDGPALPSWRAFEESFGAPLFQADFGPDQQQRYARLVRSYLLGLGLARELSLTACYLVALVNGANAQARADGQTLEEEFHAFHRMLRPVLVPHPSRVQLRLLTWQELRDRLAGDARCKKLHRFLSTHPLLAESPT